MWRARCFISPPHCPCPRPPPPSLPAQAFSCRLPLPSPSLMPPDLASAPSSMRPPSPPWSTLRAQLISSLASCLECSPGKVTFLVRTYSPLLLQSMEIWHSPSPRYSPRAYTSRGLNMSWLTIGGIGQMLQSCPTPPPLSPPHCLPSLFWLTLSPSLHSTKKPPSCNICLLKQD